MALLEVRDLKMYYRTLRGHVRAVDSVSFDIERGKALGIAGESGCGKSSMASAVLRLLPLNGEYHGGIITMDGEDILHMPEESFRQNVRWSKISMVFQGAMNALNLCIEWAIRLSRLSSSTRRCRMRMRWSGREPLTW